MVVNDKTKESLEEQNKALRAELQELKEDKADIEAENEDLRLIHMRQEDRISQLHKDIDECFADNDNLRGDYDEVAADNRALQDDYDEVRSINRTLRSNLADLNNSNFGQREDHAVSEQLTKLKAYTDELEKRLKNSEAHVRDLQERNQDLGERNEDLEDCLVIEKIQSQAVEAECKDLKRKNKALWKTVNYLDGLSEEDQIEVMRMRKGVMKLKKLWEAGELD